jgi:hypothetical protein
METTGHNLSVQLTVQANWSIAKRCLAEILALGPEGWRAEDDEWAPLVGSDELSGDLMMEIEPLEEEEDSWLT